MENINLSIFDNIFENEGVLMNHIALIGENGTGKTELIKQIIGSFLNSNKKVLILNSYNDLKSIIQSLKGYMIDNNNELTKEILVSQKLLYVNTTLVDFNEVKELLINDSSEWVIIQDEFDEVIYNYEQNDFITNKMEFIHYFSEFGKIFGVYTLVSVEDISNLFRATPSEVIFRNSRNVLVLKQSQSSISFLKEKLQLTNKQINRIEKLSKYESIFLNK